MGLEGTDPDSCMTTCENFKLHSPGDLLPHPEFEDLSWWRAQGYEAGIDPFTGSRLISLAAGSINPPMWIVEIAHEMPAADDGTIDARVWYRIVVRASGHTERAISVVESIVTRPRASAESSSAVDQGRVSWRELR